MNTYTVKIFKDPSGIADVELVEVDEGVVLLDWIIMKYGKDGFQCPTKIYYSIISGGSEVSQDFNGLNKPILCDIIIVHTPQGAVVARQVIIAIIIAVATTVLMPTPDIPGVGRAQRRSPNNAISGQANVARLLDRVPDIFGTVTSIPDLIGPTVSEYINHLLYQTNYMCIGRGYHLVEEIRTGETLISDIEGSEATVYDPGDVPDKILRTRQSNEVSGQELTAPNDQPEVIPADDYTMTYDAMTDEGYITSPVPGDDVWQAFQAGDSVEVHDIEINEFGVNISGLYIVASTTADSIVLADAAVINSDWSTLDLTPTQVLLKSDPFVIVTPEVKNTGYFNVPGDNNTEIWLDFQAPTGLAQGASQSDIMRVDLEIDFDELDSEGAPTGNTLTIPLTLSGATRDPRFFTLKYSDVNGVISGTPYRVRVRRLTDADISSNARLEKITWSRLAGLENITRPDTSRTTRLSVLTKATEQVAAIRELRFSAVVTRKTVTWDGAQVVGNIATGEGLTPSRRMADAFLHYSLDPELAARNITHVNVDAIYAVQSYLDSIFGGEKGEFSFTFDNKNTPAIEELRQIANAARCFVVREGAIFSIVRDQEQLIHRDLFNRRNKIPNSETRQYRANKPLDIDGVTLEYSDIDGATRVINLPADLPKDDPNFGLPSPLNPRAIESAGIRQYSQAWDRAQYEFNRIIYQRISVESTVSMDGILVGLNDKVSVTDGSRFDDESSDGEITHVNGLIVTTTQKCVFQAGKTYSVIIRDEYGNPSPAIPCSETGGDTFGFTLAYPPSFPIVTRGNSDLQRGSLYNFSSDQGVEDAFLVQRKIPDENGNVRLEMINYSPEYYRADNQIPPPKV